MSGDLKTYFEEDDGQGCSLVVFRHANGSAVVHIERHRDGIGSVLGSWIADPLAAPDLCRAIFEAAGQQPPVTLARPAPRDRLVPGPHGGELVKVRPSPAGQPANIPGVMLSVDGRAVRLTGDEPARVALALVDAMNDAAGDPDEVEDVAAAIREAFQSDGTPPTEWERKAARAALGRIREREVRRG